MEEEKGSKTLAINLELQDIDEELQSIQSQLNELINRQDYLSEKKAILQKDLKDLSNKEHENEVTKDWVNEKFPWDDKVMNVLLGKFNLKRFRPLQKETVNATLSKKDCIIIMPTGGGKSLCFQLPALVSSGYALVISPLVSLMEDQLMGLKTLKINAAMLNASSSKEEVKDIFNQMVTLDSPMKLLYVTPEKIAKSKRFMAKLEKSYKIGTISRIVIDEVHCASHWGHDFRPDYKILGILKRQFPTLPLLGLTATATKKVLDDVKDILSLTRNCIVFRSSFNRPNLYYEVHKTSLNKEKLVESISTRIKIQFKDLSGIIYCFSRKDSEDVADLLLEQGIKAHYYHADMTPQMKSSVHKAWSKGRLQVVVATIAFGMGIDKPNVRFVIHYSISKSIENYYQESGRAGRDDQKSWCIIYFRFQDIFRQSSMVFTEKIGLKNLYNMLDYCINHSACRRTLIGKYFGESWTQSKCKKMCDNCSNQKAWSDRDLKLDADTIIEIIENAQRIDERLTPLKIVEAWMGKGKVMLRPKKTTKLSQENCEIIMTKLLTEQVLREDFHFTPYSTITYFIAGPRWQLVKHSRIQIKQKIDNNGKGESTKKKIPASTINEKSINLVHDEKKPNENNGEINSKKRKVVLIDIDNSEDDFT